MYPNNLYPNNLSIKTPYHLFSVFNVEFSHQIVANIDLCKSTTGRSGGVSRNIYGIVRILRGFSTFGKMFVFTIMFMLALLSNENEIVVNGPRSEIHVFPCSTGELLFIISDILFLV